jgi:hypothetical protein
MEQGEMAMPSVLDKEKARKEEPKAKGSILFLLLQKSNQLNPMVMKTGSKVKSSYNAASNGDCPDLVPW